MGAIITIFLLFATGLTGSFYRIASQRQARARFTQEWIEFLQEDLVVGAL